MAVRFTSLWERLKSSLWFIPTVMAMAATALAFGMVQLDRSLSKDVRDLIPIIYEGGPDGAREVLGTVAGSMITVAGVVFSITIVAFSLASNQFGPRILRNFMRDTGNQVVLGTFIGLYIYSLVVLRTVRGEDDPVHGMFVPNASVTVCVLLAMVGLAVLIYFIHHVSVSIQADHIVNNLGDELHASVDRLFADHLGHDVDPEGVPAALLTMTHAPPSRTVVATRSGYLQAVDSDALMRLATAHDLLVRLRYRPGDFVTEGQPMAELWYLDGKGEHIREARVQRMFVIGYQRTPTQDVEFAVDQMVEVACRALSPSINDPFTVQSCLDQLGVALSRLCGRAFPSMYRHDGAHRLRIIAPVTPFAQVVDSAISNIRQYGANHAAVMISMVQMLTTVAHSARTQEQRTVLYRHAELTRRVAERSLQTEEDKQVVLSRFEDFMGVLGRMHAS